MTGWISLWMDGFVNAIAGMEFQELVDRPRKHCDLAAYKHRRCACAFQAAKACLALRNDNPEVLQRQMDKYRTEGCPLHHGRALRCKCQ